MGHLLAARRRGLSGMPYLYQTEALTHGTDTSTEPNDASF
jgi:hypothetical protein